MSRRRETFCRNLGRLAMSGIPMSPPSWAAAWTEIFILSSSSLRMVLSPLICMVTNLITKTALSVCSPNSPREDPSIGGCSIFCVVDEKSPPMAWKLRYDIAVGTARGLRYLHKECRRRIIHRDIKASNILLTANFEPQVRGSHSIGSSK